jgi:hypothetical protein
VEHIPCLRNTLFTLRAIKQYKLTHRAGKHVTHHALIYNHVARHMKAMFCSLVSKRPLRRYYMAYRSDISILLILFACSRDGQEENNDPRNPDFCPHFQVDRSNSRVQDSTLENVVNEVARHSDLRARGNSEEVHSERERKAPNHRDGHQVTKVVDNFGEAEDSGVVQCGSSEDGCPKRQERVAVVHELFVAQRGNRKTFLLPARHNPGKEKLEEYIARVDLPCIGIGASILFHGE